MIVGLIVAIAFGGFMIAMLPSLLAMAMSISFTPQQYMVITMLGGIMMFISPMIFLILAKRSSVIHLIETPRQGQVLWLYIQKGGSAYFVPSVRLAQAFLYSKGRGIVKDIGDESKISIGRHSVRIVLEKVGHTINPYMAQYASILKKKYGFKDLKQARNAGRFIYEGIVSEKAIKEYTKKKTKYEEPDKITEEDLKQLGIAKEEV